MKRTPVLAILAAGLFFSVAAVAPAQRRPGFPSARLGPRVHGGARVYGGWGGWGYPYWGWGGLGYGAWGYAAPVRTTYRNAFTGNVGYVERESNDFRREVEKGKDRLGIKSVVQALDETLESLRREAEKFGAATDRGRDLMRKAQDLEDRIDRRVRRSGDPLARPWDDLARKLDRLARDYRAD